MAELGLGRNLEEKQKSDWHKLEEENNFLVQILAPMQWVLSHSQTLSPFSLCFYNSFAYNANNSHGFFGIGKHAARKEEAHPNRWFL